jgi:LysM repeat protein
VRRLLGTTLITVLALAAPASAEVAHTVAPGESLWSIAAANNLTTRTVAAYNGLSESSTVLVGQTIRVPTSAEGSAVLQQVAPAPAAPSTAAAGGYTVQPGDNLSAIAAARGTSVSALAAANGLDPAGLLVARRPRPPPPLPAAPAPAPARSAATRCGRATRSASSPRAPVSRRPTSRP